MEFCVLLPSHSLPFFLRHGFCDFKHKKQSSWSFCCKPTSVSFFLLIFFCLNVIVIIINTYSKPNVSVFLLFNLAPNVSLSFIKHIPIELSVTKEPSPARTLLGAQIVDEEWKNELGFKAQTLTNGEESMRQCQLSTDVCGNSNSGVEV